MSFLSFNDYIEQGSSCDVPNNEGKLKRRQQRWIRYLPGVGVVFGLAVCVVTTWVVLGEYVVFTVINKSRITNSTRGKQEKRLQQSVVPSSAFCWRQIIG